MAEKWQNLNYETWSGEVDQVGTSLIDYGGDDVYFKALSFSVAGKGYSSINDIPTNLKNKFAQQTLKKLFYDLQKKPLANADELKYKLEGEKVYVLVGAKKKKADDQPAADAPEDAPGYFADKRVVSKVSELDWWSAPEQMGEFFWKPTSTNYVYYVVNTEQTPITVDPDIKASIDTAISNDGEKQTASLKGLSIEIAAKEASISFGFDPQREKPFDYFIFTYALSNILSQNGKIGIHLLQNEDITDDFKKEIVGEEAKYNLNPDNPEAKEEHVKWEIGLSKKNNKKFVFDGFGESLYWNDDIKDKQGDVTEKGFKTLADWHLTGDRPTDTILVFFAIPQKYIDAIPNVEEQHFELAEPPFDEVVFAPHTELKENTKVLEKIIKEYVDVIEDEGKAGLEIYIEGETKFFSEWVKGKEIVEYIEDEALPDLLRLHDFVKETYAKEPYNITFEKEDKIVFKFKRGEKNPYKLIKVVHLRGQSTTALTQNDITNITAEFLFPVYGATLINLNGIINKYNAGMRVGYKKFLTEQMFPDYKELFIYKSIQTPIQDKGREVWKTFTNQAEEFAVREFAGSIKRQNFMKQVEKGKPSTDKSVAGNVRDSLKVVSSIDDIYDKICRKFGITDIAADLVKCLKEKVPAAETALNIKDATRQIRNNPKKLRLMVENALLAALAPPGEEPRLTDILINGDVAKLKKEKAAWCKELIKQYPGKTCKQASDEYQTKISDSKKVLKTFVVCIDFPVEDANTFYEKPIKEIIKEVGDWLEDPNAQYDKKQAVRCVSHIAATGLALAGASDSIDKFRKAEFVNNKYIKLTGNDVPIVGQKKGARHTHTGTPREFETDINKIKAFSSGDPWKAIEKEIIELILRLAFEGIKALLNTLLEALFDAACKSDDDDKKKPDGNPGDVSLPAGPIDPNDPKWQRACLPQTPEAMATLLKSISARLTPRELCHLMNGEYYNENVDVATVIQKLIRKLDKSGGWGIEKAGIYSKSSIAKYFKKVGETFPEKFSRVCNEALNAIEAAAHAARANRELCKDLGAEAIKDLQDRLKKLGLSNEDVAKIIKNSKVKDLNALEKALDFLAEENFLDSILDEIVIEQPEIVNSAVEKSINGVFGGIEKAINAYLNDLYFKSYLPTSDFNLAVNYIVNKKEADPVIKTTIPKDQLEKIAKDKLISDIEGNYSDPNPLLSLFADDNFYEKYLDLDIYGEGNAPLEKYREMFKAAIDFKFYFRTVPTKAKSKALILSEKYNRTTLGQDVEVAFDDSGKYYQVYIWNIPMFLDFSEPSKPFPVDRAPYIHKAAEVPNVWHALRPVVDPDDKKLNDYIDKRMNKGAIESSTTSGGQPAEVFDEMFYGALKVAVDQNKGSKASFKKALISIRKNIGVQLLEMMPETTPNKMIAGAMKDFYLEEYSSPKPKPKKKLRKYKVFQKENSLVPIEKIKKQVIEIYEKK